MNTQNFVSAYVERDVMVPGSENEKDGPRYYKWAKTQGFSGKPDYIRYFPEKDNPNYGNPDHKTCNHPKINAMLSLEIAVEDRNTLETEWKDILIYDNPAEGFYPATDLAFELLDLQKDGSLGPNVKTGFLKIEGDVQPYTFKDREGNPRVKSKVRAKKIECPYSKPYGGQQQPTDSNGRKSVFTGSQQPAQATQPATPTQHSPQPQTQPQTTSQSQQPTYDQLQAQMQQLMQQMAAMQGQQQQAPTGFPTQPQFEDDVPF